MKKILFGTFLGIFALVGVAVLPNYTNATGDTDRWGPDEGRTTGENLKGIKNSITNTDSTGSQLLTSIKSAIQWILGILATVAVVICLYAGFIMMTSAGDENKYKNGMKVLKYAAIGLAIILLAWLIVSMIFWFVNKQGASGVM